jgi:hypothetical protein
MAGKAVTAAAVAEFPVMRLTCRAPHADPKKKGHPCGILLGDVPGRYEFVTVADRLPADPDGYVWLKCPGKRCGRWNKWKLIAESAVSLATVPAAGSIEERLAKLPEDQQHAVLALAGGIGIVQLSRSIGVNRKTIQRWNKNSEFRALRREIAPTLTAAHVRSALEGLFAIIEKDRKSGRADNIRYFLNRTVFADFEKGRTTAGGTTVNLNVAQHQQQTEATVKTIWEERTRGLIAPVAPAE